MRARPTALAWIDHDNSEAPDWHAAQIRRLARTLGYALVWPDIEAVIPLADQVREFDVEAVLIATPDHIDVMTLNLLMNICRVESVSPRLTFNRWAGE